MIRAPCHFRGVKAWQVAIRPQATRASSSTSQNPPLIGHGPLKLFTSFSVIIVLSPSLRSFSLVSQRRHHSGLIPRSSCSVTHIDLAETVLVVPMALFRQSKGKCPRLDHRARSPQHPSHFSLVKLKKMATLFKPQAGSGPLGRGSVGRRTTVCSRACPLPQLGHSGPGWGWGS